MREVLLNASMLMSGSLNTVTYCLRANMQDALTFAVGLSRDEAKHETGNTKYSCGQMYLLLMASQARLKVGLHD